MSSVSGYPFEGSVRDRLYSVEAMAIVFVRHCSARDMIESVTQCLSIFVSDREHPNGVEAG